MRDWAGLLTVLVLVLIPVAGGAVSAHSRIATAEVRISAIEGNQELSDKRIEKRLDRLENKIDQLIDKSIARHHAHQ